MSSQSWDAGDESGDEVVLALDGVTVREVRDLVRDLLADRAGVAVDDAVLVVDELVSNALRHGEPPRRCRLVRVGRRLRVEVDDAGLGWPRIRTADASGGRGLVIVQALAAGWGVIRHPRHKTVWAEVLLDGPSRPSHVAPAQDWGDTPARGR